MVETNAAAVAVVSRGRVGRSTVMFDVGRQPSECDLLQLSHDVSFRLLGALEMRVDGRPLPLPSGRLRSLLATLLLHADEVVSMRELVETLWDDDHPDNPRSTVQKYVMRLRRLLAPTGCVIRTDAEGYRLDVGRDQVDVHRFSGLAKRGRRLIEDGDWANGSALLAESIRLWRAVPPLGNVRSELVQREVVPRLVESYLQAVELRIEADLQLGRHAGLCEELLALVRRHPLRERFWEQRMRALASAHRRGEALAAYRELARILADELGIDPGPGVQRIHQQILRGDAVPPPSARGSSGSGMLGPRQLPMATSGVVGRSAEIAEIVRALDPVKAEGAPRLVVVHGPRGVGKSTVAVHAAHRLANAFPDGQLYAELGSDTDAENRVREVIAYFLRSLGVPAGAVPATGEDAVAAFRSATAGRRLLVVLDEAPSVGVVRALLPGSGECGVIVTSRHELAELFVTPGAQGVSLGALRREDACRVLCQEIGNERFRAEREAADELLRLCRGLPLAIRSAAAHLVTRPSLSIASYLARACQSDEVHRGSGGSGRLVPVAPARAAC